MKSNTPGITTGAGAGASSLHSPSPDASQQELLATYVIPGCVGRGVKLGSESLSGSGGAGTVWKSGNLEIWEFGDLGTWKSRNLGSPKIQNIQILKIQIHSAQNVGKVWISREKILLAPFGAIPGHFFHGSKKSKRCVKICLFSLVGQWALFTRCGPLLLSTRGGGKGIKMKICSHYVPFGG